jgi:predicted exporter
MAIDYGLFVREGAANDVHSLLAVSLSAMTTLLAFGLLGFSSTPALKDCGFIVTLGIASAWFSTLLLHRAGWMKKA